MHSYLKKEADQLGLKIDLRGTAERLDAEDNSMDAVVGTLFCVQCQILLVQEVLRVLKPGGRFYLSNTLLPHKNLVATRQSGVKPIWKVSATVATLIVKLGFENAGFESVNYHHFQAPFQLSALILRVWLKNKLEQV